MLSQSGEPDRYRLKAMNCPHHHKLYAAVPRSYRDLPLRLAEYGTSVIATSRAASLFGLMRVRSLQMNDAHIYCTPEQFETRVQRGQRDVSETISSSSGSRSIVMRFSTHDPAQLGQKVRR